jgi:hypothetical protein
MIKFVSVSYSLEPIKFAPERALHSQSINTFVPRNFNKDL